MKRAVLSCLVAAIALSWHSFSQTAPTAAPKKPDLEAQTLVRDLLTQKPAKATVVHGVFKKRNDDTRQRSQIRFTYTVQPGAENWLGIYETEATNRVVAEKLIVVHQGEKPNTYLLTQIRDPKNPPREPLALKGDAAAVPFSGTDFWLSDLGLDFLHWPEQRLITNLNIKSSWGHPFHVLESINPNPTGASYARVVSQIDRETGGLIKAEAYAVGQHKPFKVFSLKRFKKGEVKEMEIRNETANSRTQLEFSFDEE